MDSVLVDQLACRLPAIQVEGDLISILQAHAPCPKALFVGFGNIDRWKARADLVDSRCASIEDAATAALDVEPLKRIEEWPRAYIFNAHLRRGRAERKRQEAIWRRFGRGPKYGRRNCSVLPKAGFQNPNEVIAIGSQVLLARVVGVTSGLMPF